MGKKGKKGTMIVHGREWWRWASLGSWWAWASSADVFRYISLSRFRPIIAIIPFCIDEKKKKTLAVDVCFKFRAKPLQTIISYYFIYLHASCVRKNPHHNGVMTRRFAIYTPSYLTLFTSTLPFSTSFFFVFFFPSLFHCLSLCTASKCVLMVAWIRSLV